MLRGRILKQGVRSIACEIRIEKVLCEITVVMYGVKKPRGVSVMKEERGMKNTKAVEEEVFGKFCFISRGPGGGGELACLQLSMTT